MRIFLFVYGLGLALLLHPVRADVPITFPRDSTFLPEKWQKDPISAKIERLSEKDQEAARQIVETAIKKYPQALQKSALRQVYIVSSLSFFAVRYGGTYLANGREIVLVYRDTFDRRGFEQRFHHEFSSILLKRNEDSFESDRWLVANLPDFEYRAKGIIEEQTGGSSEATRVLEEEQKKTGGSGSNLLRLDETLMESGFLTSYNRVSIEQDFNETAAHLFTNPDIWTLCEKYPRIDQKVDVLIDFYRSLNQSMDRLYFRKLTLTPNP